MKDPGPAPQRGSHEWDAFVQAQRQRIVVRLERFNNRESAKEQLAEHGNVIPYQRYKIGTVSNYHRALAKVSEGSYGHCDECGGAIAYERLLRPGAVQCAAFGCKT